MTLYNTILRAILTVPGVTVQQAINSEGAISIQHITPRQDYTRLGEIVIKFQPKNRFLSESKELQSSMEEVQHQLRAARIEGTRFVGYLLVYDQGKDRVYITTVPIHSRIIEDSNRQTSSK